MTCGAYTGVRWNKKGSPTKNLYVEHSRNVDIPSVKSERERRRRHSLQVLVRPCGCRARTR